MVRGSERASEREEQHREAAIPNALRSPFPILFKREHSARRQLRKRARIASRRRAHAQEQPCKGQGIFSPFAASLSFSRPKLSSSSTTSFFLSTLQKHSISRIAFQAIRREMEKTHRHTHKIISSGFSSPTTFSSAAKSSSEPPPLLPSPPPVPPPFAPEHHASDRA